MSNIEQLREKIATITEIYIGVKENFRFVYHLHQGNSDEELKYLAIDKHLQFIRHSLWRLTVIELCKLFSTRRNDLYDIPKLVKHIKGGYFGKVEFEPLELSSWGTYINSNQKVIANLNDLRDKLYAHTDPNRSIYKSLDVYFEDIAELLDFARKVIDEISTKIGEPRLLFDSPYFESQDFDLVRILTEDHLQRIKEIRDLIKK